jgi:hypothetical protein
MHRTLLTLAAAAALLAGCDSAPTAPIAAPSAPSLARGGEPGPNDGHPAHEHKREPFATIVMNPCPPAPEPVLVEGLSQYNAHFKFVEGGNDHRLMRSTQATGLGLVTGERYQFHQLTVVYGSFRLQNGRSESEETTRYHVISQGPLGNFFTTIKSRSSFSPEEGFRTEVVSAESDCRG